jgi:hypothetical protein
VRLQALTLDFFDLPTKAELEARRRGLEKLAAAWILPRWTCEMSGALYLSSDWIHHWQRARTDACIRRN